MKIFFPKNSSGAFLNRKRGARCVISSTIIDFFAGLCGSYLLENNFWLLAIALLGIASVLLSLGGAGSAVLGWREVEETRSTRIRKYAPQITSGWDYRPRKAIRRYPAVASAGTETSEVLSPEPFAINNNVWLSNDSREYAPHGFFNLDTTVEDSTAKAPLSDHESAVSTYD